MGVFNPIGLMIFVGLALWMFVSARERSQQRGKPSLLWIVFVYAIFMTLYHSGLFSPAR